MKEYHKISFRVTLFLVAIVFICSCTSRQWVNPGDYEITTGDTVYRVVTLESDTLSFIGTPANEVEQTTETGQQINRIGGDGGVFVDGMINGFCSDGLIREISIHTASLIEVDKTDKGKTALTVVSGLAATGFLLYAIINASSDEQYDPPCGK